MFSMSSGGSVISGELGQFRAGASVLATPNAPTELTEISIYRNLRIRKLS
jgi:hypothetical protein